MKVNLSYENNLKISSNKKLEEIPNWNDSGNETFNTVSKNLTSSEHHVEITMSGLDN